MKRFSAPALLMFLLPVSAFAVPLELHYGANSVDINGDGVPDLITKVRWNNGNAHSFDKYLISVQVRDGYRRVGDEKQTDAVMEEVPLGDGYKYDFMTQEGADCVLADYVFSLNKQKQLVVKYYEREFGESFEDKMPVTVTTYSLTDSAKENKMAEWGVAPLYLKKVTGKKLTKRVCDVRDVEEK